MSNLKKVLLVGGNGYIGSRVYGELIEKKVDVIVIDNFLRSDLIENKETIIINKSYQNLKPDFLDQFTDCIWLAGHSSVHASINDEHGAITNNLVDLISFVNLFRGRFIYASSGSVYSRDLAEVSVESSPNMVPKNIYDYTKIAFDNYLGSTKKKAIGLRFGTVNGFSNRIRNELIVNSMVKSCKENNCLTVNNLDTWRPILFIDDLVDGIFRILESDVETGIYNMASVNHKIGEIASIVSEIMRAEVKYANPSITYNFKMDSSLFEKTFDFKFKGNISKIVQSLL